MFPVLPPLCPHEGRALGSVFFTTLVPARGLGPSIQKVLNKYPLVNVPERHGDGSQRSKAPVRAWGKVWDPKPCGPLSKMGSTEQPHGAVCLPRLVEGKLVALWRVTRRRAPAKAMGCPPWGASLTLVLQAHVGAGASRGNGGEGETAKTRSSRQARRIYLPNPGSDHARRVCG